MHVKEVTWTYLLGWQWIALGVLIIINIVFFRRFIYCSPGTVCLVRIAGHLQNLVLIIVRIYSRTDPIVTIKSPSCFMVSHVRSKQSPPRIVRPVINIVFFVVHGIVRYHDIPQIKVVRLFPFLCLRTRVSLRRLSNYGTSPVCYSGCVSFMRLDFRTPSKASSFFVPFDDMREA